MDKIADGDRLSIHGNVVGIAIDWVTYLHRKLTTAARVRPAVNTWVSEKLKNFMAYRLRYA